MIPGQSMGRFSRILVVLLAMIALVLSSAGRNASHAEVARKLLHSEVITAGAADPSHVHHQHQHTEEHGDLRDVEAKPGGEPSGKSAHDDTANNCCVSACSSALLFSPGPGLEPLGSKVIVHDLPLNAIHEADTAPHDRPPRATAVNAG
jgi:hypothetical protein